MRSYVTTQLEESHATLVGMLQDEKLIRTLENVAEVCVSAFLNQRKILLAGNGGSAADCQHIAGELACRYMFDRPALAAVALSTDSAVMTAISNDYDYEDVFSRQIEALGHKGDIFWAYSTSGTSKNILKAIDSATSKGLTTVGLTGKDRLQMREMCDFCIEIPTTITPKIQEGQLVVGHILCGLIENTLFQTEAKEHSLKTIPTTTE